MNPISDQSSSETEEKIVKQGVHNYSSAKTYIPPTEPLSQKQLEWFQDQKLALMIHWGLYCQLGMVASWALSDDDGSWSRHQVDWTDNPELFKKQYSGLNRSFNPVRFQPELWAEFAADCGFRYLIFTTKHAEGFCLWDTKYSDYKVTAEDCPFHTHPYADIVRHTFNAFRDKGIAIGAYFSKADWHSPYYWNKELGEGRPSWRGPSYDPAKHPEIWAKYVGYTHNQILELCKNYGRIDILWLDCGWVCKSSGEDIEIGKAVEEARKSQPWLIAVDRTVGGPYENYVTPEKCVPDAPLGIPWESCMTVGDDFAYEFDDSYKSSRQLICLLVDVVAKGGNLALNISPQPDGRLPAGAMASARGLGAWLKVNGDAIYGTRVCAPYKIGNVAFTRKNHVVYAIVTYPDARETILPDVEIPYADEVSSVTLLENGEKLSFSQDSGALHVILPIRLLARELPPARVFILKSLYA